MGLKFGSHYRVLKPKPYNALLKFCYYMAREAGAKLKSNYFIGFLIMWARALVIVHAGLLSQMVTKA
jgi:hypothetical protein